MTEYEIIMFKDSAVVDGSRTITSDIKLIESATEYAKSKGYVFSCTKITKEALEK
jgi:hypothetical protein